ncbi:MAG TPA: exosortase E/protease, VPEID-CTERM system [Bryobacteraceae bacterium]
MVRLVLLVAILALEWIPLSNLVQIGGGLARLILSSLTIFVAFGYSRVRSSLPRLLEGVDFTFRWGYLAAHFASLLTFAGIAWKIPGWHVPAVAFCLLALPSTICALFAFVPVELCAEIVRGTGNAWIYAGLGGLATWRLADDFGSLWQPGSQNFVLNLTFASVKALLEVCVRDVIADRSILQIGTTHFQVIVAQVCSGLEGMGLMLALSVTWLWFFRKESRFPQSLLLVPASLVLVWALNVVRITALILIGNAGAGDIAVGGFHSQAGWIGFNGAALAFAVAARRLPWLNKSPGATVVAARAENPTGAYLMPFLAILAAALVSAAFSSGFEWAYPLRLLAAVPALWAYRAAYRELDWRCGWQAAAAGAAVFGMWIALDRWSGQGSDSGIAAGLAGLPAAARTGWVVCRVAAAVVTVPLAEELAFRGFLARRLISERFEAVAFRRISPLALMISSVAFGLLHGRMWAGGIVAGLMFGGLLRRSGRIGDAVMAHATSNALLAAWVLAGGHWHLW